MFSNRRSASSMSMAFDSRTLPPVFNTPTNYENHSESACVRGCSLLA